MGTEHPEYLDRFAKVAPRVSKVPFKSAALGTVILLGLTAERVEAFDLDGRYATPGLGTIISFEACPERSDITCARLVWAWDAREMKGAKVGDVIASKLDFDGSAWRGEMVSPENGWKVQGYDPDGETRSSRRTWLRRTGLCQSDVVFGRNAKASPEPILSPTAAPHTYHGRDRAGSTNGRYVGCDRSIRLGW